MLKRIFPILLGMAVFLSACGTPATPTMAPADVQNTAVAAAWTMVAATNMAIPTATPLPPTEVPSPTSLPTFTPEPLLLPTAAFPTVSVPPTQVSGGDPCNRILNTAEAGQATKKYIRVENTTNGTATFGLTLTSPNSFGQCGYLTGFNNILKKGANVKLSIPSGCWYAWAYISDKGGAQHIAEGTHCYGDSKTDDLNRVIIKDYMITFVGP